MYRHSPVRNPRSKGIKIKNVLQICLLVAVCFWLIFQVKRSHDKKKEFKANDTKISLSTHSTGEIVKFGRKDLQPKLEDSTEVEKHEEEEQEDQEENKHEEEEQDEEKIEEEKDDGGGGGDDEIDENEQEKSDVEIEREEVDAVDEESDEKENEEKDGQSQSQTENGDDQDGATRNTREAREEHYKADDASSAVTHDSPTVGIENAKGASSLNITEIQETGFEENGPPSNTTVIASDSTQSQNINQFVSNSTFSEETEKTSNSSNISEESESKESIDEGEISDNNNVTEGNEETLDEVEHETNDLSHLEEKEVRTDLETLPEIETEGGNSEDAAVE